MSTSRNFEHLLSYTKQELIQMPLRDMVDAASLVEFDHLCEEIRLGKTFKYAHLELRDKYGEQVKVEAQIEPEKTGSKLIASNWNIHDITNLQDAQKNFLDDYRQYASVFGFSRVPTLLINKRLCVLQVNLAACRLFDYDASDILGTNLLELLDAEDKDAFAETFHEQVDGNADRAETELGFTRLDAEPVRCHVKTTVIRNAKKLPRLLLLEVTEP